MPLSVLCTPRQLLTSLRPPVSDGLVVNATAVRERLRILAGYLGDPGEALRLLIEDTASLIETGSKSSVRTGTIHNPSLGVTRLHPTWAAMTGQNLAVGPALGDPVRAIILVAHIRHAARSDKEVVDPAEGLTGLVRRFDTVLDETAIAVLNGAAEPVYAALRHPSKSNGELALRHLFIALDACRIEKTPQARLRRLLKEVFEAWPTVLPHRGPVVNYDAPSGDGALLIPSSASSSADDETAGDCLVTAPPEEREHGLLNERRAAERSAYLVTRCLVYGSDQTLLEPESRALAAFLLAEAQAALTTGDRQAAATAIVYLLCLLTSRGFVDLAHLGIARDWIGDQNAPLHIDLKRGTWSSLIPGARNFWRSSTPDFGVIPVGPRLESPLPLTILQILRRIVAEGSSDEEVLLSRDPYRLQRSREGLRNRVLAESTPRFSETRLRFTLPALILRKTGDPCHALMLTGDSLGQSSAPLHYYAESRSDHAARYRHVCLESLGLDVGDTMPLAPADTEMVGAPLAAIPAAVFHDFVAVLIADTRGAPRKHPRAHALMSYNALVKYTVRMWGAATGHRLNLNVGEIRLSQVDNRGWAVMDDKLIDASSSARAVVIPPLLLRQLENLRHAQNELLNWCPRSTQRQLRAAIEGRGPLFLLVDPAAGHAHAVGPDDLRHPWLDARGLPRYLFRMRLRMALTKRGVAPELIYRQMGHVINGLPPFSIRCPSSVDEVARLLSGALDCYLRDDGWQAIPAATTRRKPLSSWPCRTLSDPLVAETKRAVTALFRDWKRARRERVIRRAADEREQTDAWVLGCLQLAAPTHQPSKPATGVHITEDLVYRWLDSLREEGVSMAQYQFRLLALRSAIVALRKTKDWTGVLPPRLFERRFEPPPVMVQHVQAARLFHALRLHALGSVFHELVPEESWARLAQLLITDYTVLDIDQLSDAFTRIGANEAVADPQVPGQDLVGITLSSGHRRAVRLSRSATLLARRLGGVGAPPSCVRIEQLLASSLPLKVRGRSESRILERLFGVQSLALRIERPGVHWPLLEQRDPHTLTLERTLDLRDNAIGFQANRLNQDPSERRTGAAGLATVHGRRDEQTRYRQYMDFRRSLSELREPTAKDQGLDRRRYSKARALCRTYLGDEQVDETVGLLVGFVRSTITARRRIRIGTAYDYLTGIGSSMLRALDDRSIPDLDGDELGEVFESILEQTPASRKAGVASRLLRFYRLFEDRLGDADLSLITDLAGHEDLAVTRAMTVTAAEYSAIREALGWLVTEGGLSDTEALQARNALALMWHAGLRTREVTHRTLNDVIEVDGSTLLYIRSTPLGLVKTRAARRVINLTEVLGSEELDDFHGLCRYAQDHKEESARSSPPLFLTARIGESARDYDRRRASAEDLIRVVRVALRVVTGEDGVSLHALRHAAASRTLANAWMNRRDPPVDNYRLSQKLSGTAVFLGHSDYPVSFQHYWHLAHLVAFAEEPLNSRAEGWLRGSSAEAIRKRRSRKQERPVVNWSVPADCNAPVDTDRQDAGAFDLLPEIARRIRMELGGTPYGLVAMLATLHRGQSLGRILPKVRARSAVIRAALEALQDLSLETTLVFLSEEVRVRLGEQYRLPLDPLPHRSRRAIPNRRVLRDTAQLNATAAHAERMTAIDRRLLWSACRKGWRSLSQRENLIVEDIRRHRFDPMACAWTSAISSALEAAKRTG